MAKALDWVKRHRGIVAAIAAVWVVLKAGRWIAGGAWAAREWIPWDDVWPWLRDHWVVGVAAAVVLFLLVFVAVRALIGVLDRRSRRRKVEAAHTAEPLDPGRPPAGDGLTAGDPLAARER